MIQQRPISYQELAVQVAGTLLGADKADWKTIEGDTAWSVACQQAWLIANQDVPVYWVTKDLAQAFLQTSLPSHVCDIKRIVPCGILMLPSLLKNPDGQYLQWVMF